ncbi:MAG: ACP S-malonyltransferase [Clostridia bacterium]|nr:ACP S-malonyltransferase [Clostridia bacterium]
MKRAILFPGQGAQETGMGKDLYESSAVYREVFDSIDAGLDFSLKESCFEGVNMDKSEYVQPAIYAHSVALLKALGIGADIYAGLSLGEYSAMTAVNMQDAVKGAQLVNQRGNIMDSAVEYGKGGMMSVLGLDMESVEKALAEYGNIWVANHLSEGNIIIAGEKESVEKSESRFIELGAKTIVLNTSGPFHTPMLESAAEKFIEHLKKADFKEPDAIIYSNYTAMPYESAADAPHLLSKQMSNPVRWHEITEKLIALGVDEFVEIGPSMVLSKMLKRRLKESDVKIHSVRNLKTFEKYLEEQKETYNG